MNRVAHLCEHREAHAAIATRRGTPVNPLSGLDSLFLHLETAETPMHVASLHLYDLPEEYQGDFYTK